VTPTWVFMQSARYFCLILTKFGISWRIFKTLPNLQFHRSPSSGPALVHGDRRTNRQTDVNNEAFFATMRTHLKCLWNFPSSAVPSWQWSDRHEGKALCMTEFKVLYGAQEKTVQQGPRNGKVPRSANSKSFTTVFLGPRANAELVLPFRIALHATHPALRALLQYFIVISPLRILKNNSYLTQRIPCSAVGQPTTFI
jgi:hypothetical protein